ncbi:hypothetical protein ACIOHC_36185 [Streptomyces sp. NPDC088252]|uniref:hypothetical protein n=1 Tax=Streptomyces sp. NPDC088252 TaxID=3365845 RepID=UPI0038277CD0
MSRRKDPPDAAAEAVVVLKLLSEATEELGTLDMTKLLGRENIVGVMAGEDELLRRGLVSRRWVDDEVRSPLMLMGTEIKFGAHLYRLTAAGWDEMKVIEKGEGK